MQSYRHFVLAVLAAMVASGAVSAPNDKRVSQMSIGERRMYERTSALSPQSLDAIARTTTPAAIRQKTEEILSLGSLAIGARPVDSDGRAPIHTHLLAKIRSLESAGVKYIGSVKGILAVPVSVDHLQNPADREKPSSLTVGDKTYPVWPVWPNGPMPSLCPANVPLSGPLVDAGKGEWTDLDGLDFTGAIAVMSFAGGRNWERLITLGAKAVVVIEDEFVERNAATGLFCNTPVPFPRFYVDAKAGAAIRDSAVRRTVTGHGDQASVAAASKATLSGGSLYENRPVESILAYLPPTKPQTYTVSRNDLLDRIAIENGSSLDQILSENKFQPGQETKPGMRIDIPGRVDPYIVQERDLLQRLAQEFGLTADVLIAANDLKDAELKTGQTLTIPNINDTMVIMCRIDSVSAVPDAPHGGTVAANVATAITMLEHLATVENIVRRRGVLFAFMDGDNHGGISTRAIAEHLLKKQGDLKAAVSQTEEAGSGMFRFFLILLLTAAMTGAGFLLAHVIKQKAMKQDGVASTVRPWLPLLITVSLALVGMVAGMLIPLKAKQADESGEKPQTTEALRIDAYRKSLAWFADPSSTTLKDDQVDWLAGDWLAANFEKSRVQLAETRINVIMQLIEGKNSDTNSLQAELKRLDSEISHLADIRRTTFGSEKSKAMDKLSTFRARMLEPMTASRLKPYDLTLDALLGRMRAEMDEEVGIQTIADNNASVIDTIVDILHPDKTDDQKRQRMGVPAWLLWLTDGSHTLTAESDRDCMQGPIPGGAAARNMESRFSGIAAYAGVTAGWTEEWTYFGGRSPEFTVTHADPMPPVYGEFLSVAKITPAVLCTVNDGRPLLDTPHDLPERMNFTNIAIQARTALVMMKAGLETPSCNISTGTGSSQTAKFGRLVGSVRRFNIRSGIDARDPVPHAYVYYPGVARNHPSPENTAVAMGARPGIMTITQLNGRYAMPPESIDYHRKRGLAILNAYRIDRASAVFNMVADQASIGTQKQSGTFALVAGRDVDKIVVITPAYPLSIMLDVNPMDYRQIPDPRNKSADSVSIIDAVMNGPPRHFAVDNPSLQYGEHGISSTILYAPAGRPIRTILSDKSLTYALLIGKFIDEKDDKGRGYPVGPVGTDRNLAVTMTPLHIADDFLQVAERRIAQYRTFGIRDQGIDSAVRRAHEKRDEARRFTELRQWQSSIGAARESWGILIKNYPSLMNLGREAVFSVIFLMAILMPASVFLERLVVGSKGIIAQLIGAASFFIAGTLFLNYLHPAFKIAVSPFIVVIAFIMIIMSVYVLSLCYERFEVLVRRARIAGGEIEGEEISLASSLATAFSLGVSNLKKRPTRTVLTAFTVAVLTFSIVTFVSVKGSSTVLHKNLSLDTDVEGTDVTPLSPSYDGVLFRAFNWAAMQPSFVSAIETEYGRRFGISTRSAYVESSGGNNADVEGRNQIEVFGARDSDIINGLMVFQPCETNFSRLHGAVTRGQWFSDGDPANGIPPHRFHVILPDKTAEVLGIKESMIYDANGKLKPDNQLPQVRMMNKRWRVIGILDTDKADRIRDVNGRSLALVDYISSGISVNVGGILENESATHHWSWRRLAIVPDRAKSDVGAKIMSLAIRFSPGDDVNGFLSDLAIRQNNAVFGHIAGKVSLLTTRKKQSVGGLAKIIVPVILCILIVANTMMGTVDERKGEVEMLGAVGLSPRQISFLLMSEATVFSVLGIIFGVFGGLAFAKLLLLNPGILGGLSLNFTSMASTALALSTGLIVLIATLVPARRAAALAAPSGMEKWKLPPAGEDGTITFNLPFTLTRGNAVGMLAFFRRFMLNHIEATSQDFNCRNITASIQDEPQSALNLTAQMWLAPYDLDVAQHLSLRIVPTEHEGVCSVLIVLHRTSGTEEAWLRTNYGFMDLVRYQFLVWRNLGTTMRTKYIEEGAELLKKNPDRK